MPARLPRPSVLMVLCAVAALTAGCAPPDPTTELAARMDALVTEVETLQQEVVATRQEVSAARGEAAAAGEDARRTRELLAAASAEVTEAPEELVAIARVPDAAPELLGPAFPTDFPVPEGLMVAERPAPTVRDGAVVAEVTAVVPAPVGEVAAFFDAYLTPAAGYAVEPVLPASSAGAPSIRQAQRDVVEADGELVPRWELTVELTGTEDGTTTLRLESVAREVSTGS